MSDTLLYLDAKLRPTTRDQAVLLHVTGPNGKDEWLRPVAKSKGFNPDQPRDALGRFGDGSSVQQRLSAPTRTFKSMSGANKFLVEQSSALPTTSAEQFTLDVYKGSGYSPINKYLRKGIGKIPVAMPTGMPYNASNEDRLNTHIQRLDSAIERSVLGTNVTTYRGVTAGAFPDQNMTGGVFDDPGFMSTSLDKSFAEAWDSDVLLEIRLHPGDTGLGITAAMGSTDNDVESELLLPRGQEYVVLSDDYGSPDADPQIRHIIVEVAPSVQKGFNPDQSRDAQGRFGSGGSRPNESRVSRATRQLPAGDYKAANDYTREKMYVQMSSREKEAVEFYKGSGYTQLNGYLRDGTEPEIDVSNLDAETPSGLSLKAGTMTKAIRCPRTAGRWKLRTMR